jgi:hypothetical protein
MRRRARLRSEVVARSRNGARILAPDDRRGVDVRNRKCDRLRGVEGCVALGQTADRTAAVLRVPIGPLVSRSRRRRGIAVADLDRASGSEAAKAAAQQPAIGARICTARAIKTIGRNFRSRCRISQFTQRHCVTPESAEVEFQPRFSSAWRTFPGRMSPPCRHSRVRKMPRRLATFER